jgi:two-component system nitrate/nitrite response regulator NarP
MAIEVILADKNPLVLRGLAQLFGAKSRIRLAATVSDGRKFLAELRKRPFDVGVIGWEMPGADGRAVLQALRTIDHAPPIVVYTGAADASLPRQVMALGAAGFVSKSEPPEVLINTLAEVAAGRMVFPFVDVRLLNQAASHVLTPREVEMLATLASGASNRDLAARHAISLHTVKFHLKNIYAKLNASNRAQAVAIYLSARERGR